jgi:cytochrome c oxidase subunit 4
MTNHIVPLKTYYGIFISLIVLLGLTVVFAKIDIPPSPFVIGASIAFAIAAAKAILIIMYFMHVRYNRKLIWVVAVAGFFWLAILFVFTFNDYMTRPHFDGFAY